MSDLEKYVKHELEKRMYNIYYHNLNIIKDKIIVTEYDIISEGFVIEVKSGNEFINKNQIVNQKKYLPEGFKLYYFCPLMLTENLSEYKSIYKDIEFINTLEPIFDTHKPIMNLNIKSQRHFTKFLSLHLETLKRFKKIYVDHTTYYYTYITVKYHNDYYNLNDAEMIYHSSKIDYLVHNDILKIVDTFDNNLPMANTKTPIKKVWVNKEDKIKIKKIYELPSTKGMLQKVYHPQKFPYIPGITRLCNCGKNYVFQSTKKEICNSNCY